MYRIKVFNFLKTNAFEIVLSIVFICLVGFYSEVHFKTIERSNGFSYESGEFLSDRYLNMSMAKTVHEHGVNFLDPVNRKDVIFYQFFPYWVLGFASKWLMVSPWELANMIQLFLLPLFFFVIYFLGREMTGDRWTALLAVALALTFGNLEHFFFGFNGVYGKHAILLNLPRTLFGFYLDNYSLLFGYSSLFFLLRYLRSGRHRSDLALFLFLFSLATLFHLLPALFFILLVYALLLQDGIPRYFETKKRKIVWVVLGIFYLAALLTYGSLTPLWIPGLLLLYGGWLNFYATTEKNILILICALIPLIIYLASNAFIFTMHNDNVENYLDVVRKIDLHIPFYIFFISYFPILIPAIFSVFQSKKNLFTYGIFLAVPILMIYNNFFGYNNHPYRYIPYTFPILAILAAMGLKDFFENRKHYFFILLLIVLIPSSFVAGWAGLVEYKTVSESKFVNLKVDLDRKSLIDFINSESSDLVYFVHHYKLKPYMLTPYVVNHFFSSSILAIGPKPYVKIYASTPASFLFEFIPLKDDKNINRVIIPIFWAYQMPAKSIVYVNNTYAVLNTKYLQN